MSLQAVRISKTTYKVLRAEPYVRPADLESHAAWGDDWGTVWRLEGGKTLIFNKHLETYTLWSGWKGLPKLVNPELFWAAPVGWQAV